MLCRSPLVPALVLASAAASAQTVEVGVGAVPGHLQYLDVARECCPPLVWSTFGSGRWRLQVDYLRSVREAEGHGNYPHDDVEGRRASVQRASLTIEPRHETNVLASWRALERPGHSVSVLFGVMYSGGWRAFCVAAEGPVVRIPTPRDWPSDYVVFRQELTPDERMRCPDERRHDTTLRGFLVQAGAVLDVDLGKRFFLRAGARLGLFRGEVGVGVRFLAPWRRSRHSRGSAPNGSTDRVRSASPLRGRRCARAVGPRLIPHRRRGHAQGRP